MGLLVLGACLALPRPLPAAPARVVISLSGFTLRLSEGGGNRVFPVGVGRRLPDGKEGPSGVLTTGPDPRDPVFYQESRREPAFHQGLPFLRLVRPRVGGDGRPIHPYGIHGPITPSLIWGMVSAGCIRMRPEDIRALFRVARRNPSMPVVFIRERDQLEGRPVTVDERGAADPSCPEARPGVRRLARLSLGRPIADRICGGVDHWYAVDLGGGDRLSLQLRQEGALRLELYGLRAISTVARGRFSLEHGVPLVGRNRGDRYLRIVAPAGRRTHHAYTLIGSLGGT